MAGKTLVVRRRTGFGGENPENPVVNELLSTRLGPDDEIEVTTEHADVVTTAGAVGQEGADPEYVEEEVVVVTIFQPGDPENPKEKRAKAAKRKSSAKKKSTAKKPAAKRSTTRKKA